MRFWKGHGLGNDYIVLDAADWGQPSAAVIRAICDRHRGVGSDGVLLGDVIADPVSLRIFNPDGTEAEKSGNGLRIFGAWLHGQGRVGERFEVRLPAESIAMEVERVEPDGARVIRVAMGRASFRAGDVGYAGAAADAEALGAPLDLGGGDVVSIHPISLGNPHCVVLLDALDDAEFRRLAPRVQAHRLFPKGVNVQFARVTGPSELEARIWERGAGETLASGSSACAVVAAAKRAGRVKGQQFVVRMPGGNVDITIDDEWNIQLVGPAVIVYSGEIEDDVVRAWRSG